jgi:hypothetical protein
MPADGISLPFTIRLAETSARPVRKSIKIINTHRPCRILPHVRFRRVQTLVREGSPLVKLRNSA